MKMHIYSRTKAIVATDVVSDIVTMEKGQSREKSTRDIKNLCILPKNSAEGLWPRRERCFITYLSMRILPKKLPHILPKS